MFRLLRSGFDLLDQAYRMCELAGLQLAAGLESQAAVSVFNAERELRAAYASAFARSFWGAF